MKWFRITSLGWQSVIFLALVIFLVWESMPVPGPDGKVLIELYELSFDNIAQKYKKLTPFTREGNLFGEDRVSIVKLNRKEPIKPLLWMVTTFPSLIEHLPRKYLCTMRGGWFPEVSLTVEQWKRLQAYRRDAKELLNCLCYE